MWQGQDAGHSNSFFRRMWLHAWFSGAAYVTLEASICYLWEPALTDEGHTVICTVMYCPCMDSPCQREWGEGNCDGVASVARP